MHCRNKINKCDVSENMGWGEDADRRMMQAGGRGVRCRDLVLLWSLPLSNAAAVKAFYISTSVWTHTVYPPICPPLPCPLILFICTYIDICVILWLYFISHVTSPLSFHKFTNVCHSRVISEYIFWNVSSSVADPWQFGREPDTDPWICIYLWLTDSDPNPNHVIFVSDLQDGI